MQRYGVPPGLAFCASSTLLEVDAMGIITFRRKMENAGGRRGRAFAHARLLAKLALSPSRSALLVMSMGKEGTGGTSGDGAPLNVVGLVFLVEQGKNGGGRKVKPGNGAGVISDWANANTNADSARRSESDVQQANEMKGVDGTAPAMLEGRQRPGERVRTGMVELLISVDAAEVGDRRQVHEMW